MEVSSSIYFLSGSCIKCYSEELLRLKLKCIRNLVQCDRFDGSVDLDFLLAKKRDCMNCLLAWVQSQSRKHYRHGPVFANVFLIYCFICSFRNGIPTALLNRMVVSPSSESSYAAAGADISLIEIIHLGFLQIWSDSILIRIEGGNWQNTLWVVSIGSGKW